MQDPGAELLVAWVAAMALVAVRVLVALASWADHSPWLVMGGVALWLGLPIAVIALSLVAGSPSWRAGKAADSGECGPITFGLGIGLYTVPHVLALAAPWVGVAAAFRLAMAAFVVVTLLCWGLAFCLSHLPGPRGRP